MSTEDLSPEPQGIAVIGMSCRFPGARDVQALWQNLRTGVRSIRAFSDAELEASGVDPELPNHPSYVNAGATVEDIDRFDADFFALTPRAAELTDPQHRLFLECAWEALERAGYVPETFDGSIGVYAGVSFGSYLLTRVAADPGILVEHDELALAFGNRTDHLSTSLAYRLNLSGPAVTVQTTCSTSLVAAHLACQSLLGFECDMALVGGVRLSIPQEMGYLYTAGGILSPDGRCQPFDVESGGTVAGNGGGVVVLKRVADALEDGDHIHAVILGSAINNDGSGKVGYSAPSESGQAQAIAMAQAMADVEPRDIGYLETHGTATPLGDAVEIAALKRVFRKRTRDRGFCQLGAIKANLGHLDTAAGIAGLIKTALVLEGEEIPPIAGFTAPNPELDLDHSPFTVPAEAVPWPAADQPRRAGVSAFGIGGTNAHAVLEEAPARPPSQPGRPWQILPLSARSPQALEAASERLRRDLEEHPDRQLADVAFTLQRGRRAFPHRRVVVCRDSQDGIAALEQLDPQRVFTSLQEPVERGVAFLFPGQGAQHVDMGRELYDGEPAFRRELDRCCERLTPHVGQDLRRLLFPPPEQDKAAETLRRTAFAQPALFAVEYALARLWQDRGIEPRALLGHSVGEYVAACLAGVFSLEDALALVAARGRLMQDLPPGAMTAVPLGEDEVRPRLGAELSIAAVNRPARCVVSGPTAAVEALEQQLEAEGVVCRRLHTSHAFHSAMMDGVLETFAREVEKVERQAPQIPFLSNVTGDWIRPEEATDPDYWVRHLRGTVRFSEGVERLAEEPNTVLLEVGPGNTMGSLVRKHPARTRGQVVLSSLPHARAGGGDFAHYLAILGRLWIAGVEIDWAACHCGEQRRRVPLATYPFERRRYWLEARAGTVPRRRRSDLGAWFDVPSWRRVPRIPATPDEEAGDWLLFVTPEGPGPALAQRLEALGHRVVRVTVGESFAGSSEAGYRVHPTQLQDYQALLEVLPSGPLRIVHAWCVDAAGESEAVELGFDSLCTLGRVLGRGAQERSVELVVLSSGVHEVIGGEELCPEKATLLGPLRVLPKEVPGLTCRSIDVDPTSAGGPEGDALDLLVAEILSPPDEPEVAHRGGHRWLPGFEPLPLEPASEAAGLRPRGVYLITGGLGGMGLELAEFLARQVQARLVLCGRSALPPRRTWATRAQQDDATARTLARLLKLEELGAEVLVLRVDVADRTALAAALDEVKQRFGDLHGVVHAAGVAPAGPLALRTPQELAAVLAPKVAGTRALEHCLAGQPLDFLVLCSSRSSFLAPPGATAYTAANAFLDAYAHSRRREGGKVVSIDWCGWRQVGMLVDAAAGPAASPAPGPAESEPAGAVDGEPLDYPLLDRVQRLDDGGRTFHGTWSVAEKWVLDDHRILGHPVIPGTTYMEMARAALAHGGHQGAFELHDIFYLTPARFRDDEVRPLRFTTSVPDPGFDFEIETRSAEAGWVKHALGKIRPLPAPPEAHRFPEEYLRRCDQGEIVIERDEVPSEDFGPRWLVLERVYLGDGEALGVLALAPELAADLETLELHPALMDRATSVGVQYLIDSSYASLPLSYKSVKVRGPLPRRFYSYCRLREGGTRDETVGFDVELFAEDGLLLAEIDDYRRKRVHDPGEQLRAGAAETSPAPSPPAPRDQPDGERFDRTFAAGLDPDQGVEVFARLLAWPTPPQVVVSPTDLEAMVAEYRAHTADRLVEEGTGESSGADHPRPELATEYVAPTGDLERRLASVWQKVLGIEQVGIHDDFFELGGDSVQAIQIIAALGKAGIEVTPEDFFQHQTIARLAELAGAGGEGTAAAGPIPLVASQLRHLEPISDSAPAARTSLLFIARTQAAPGLLHQALAQVAAAHPALALRFVEGEAGWQQHAAGPVPWTHCDLSALPAASRDAAVAVLGAALAASPLDPRRGPGCRFVYLESGAGEPGQLWAGWHRAVADAASWSILLADLDAACTQLADGRETEPPVPPVPFTRWAREQAEAGLGAPEQFDAWLAALPESPPTLPFDAPEQPSETSHLSRMVVELSREEARSLDEEVGRAYRAEVEEAVLTALARAFVQRGAGALSVDVAADGRQSEGGEDLARTVGPLTHAFPLLLEVSGTAGPGEALKAVKERRRRIPGDGAGFGWLRHASAADPTQEQLAGRPRPAVSFGFRRTEAASRDLITAGETPPALAPAYLLGIEAELGDGLRLSWSYSSRELQDGDVRDLATATIEALRELIAHCRSHTSEAYTPSDFPLADLDQGALDQLADLVAEADDSGITG